MNYLPTAAEILGLLCLVLVGYILWSYVSYETIRRIMHKGLQKAEADGSDYVRIPRNQIIEVMGWSKIYELRPAGYEFKGKPSFRHPSTLAPVRRKKLGN
jgi:hypothetical protein